MLRKKDRIIDARTLSRLKVHASVFKALAHPTRLFIVEELRRGERCVCELTELVGADISTVSKHLTLLKQASIVRDEKRGTQVYYKLRMDCVTDFLRCVNAVVRNSAEERFEQCCCKADRVSKRRRDR